MNTASMGSPRFLASPQHANSIPPLLSLDVTASAFEPSSNVDANLSSSLPAPELVFPTEGLNRSTSDGAVQPFMSTNYDAIAPAAYGDLHLTLAHRTDPFFGHRSLKSEGRRRTDPEYFHRLHTFHSNGNGSSLARNAASEQRKERERTELIEMILESIANVPMALEQIHTNKRLRAALTQEIGHEHELLTRLFEATDSQTGSAPLFDDDDDGGDGGSLQDGLLVDEGSSEIENEDEEDENDGSSAYDSDYEKDLAEAVNQLVMTESVLSNAEKISEPIAITATVSADRVSNRASNSPQSMHSSVFGASPGTYSQDGEPSAALWPRKPHQFAFTQEEEEEDQGARAQDEVYSEMMSSMCEDEIFGQDEEGPREYEELEKVFEMEDDDNGDDLSYEHAQILLDVTSPSTSTYDVGDRIEQWRSEADDDERIDDEALINGEDGDDENEEEEDDDDGDREYDVIQLRVVREKHCTGFEANEDWRPRCGSVVGARYRVQMEIGEAVFSRTYKCVDLHTNEAVCLKVIKNSKEYFDQGVDEIRVLQYISEHCDVDEKHLVRLLDFFYFREHLIIVTELLRDNLYEFSKLLMDRGKVNYFTTPRLKKVAIEVLEALSLLHSIGIMHCDLKPENILISNFNECAVKVIDFGSACFVTDELTSYVQSRSYRAPEVILGLVYDQKIDIWSLGCVLAELFTGEVLFKNDSEQSLLERIIGAIGVIPAELLQENRDLIIQFTQNPSFALDPMTGDGVLSPQHPPLPSLESLLQTSDAEFLDFLRALLQIHPAQRLTADEALQHPWLQHGTFSRSMDNRT